MSFFSLKRKKPRARSNQIAKESFFFTKRKKKLGEFSFGQAFYTQAPSRKKKKKLSEQAKGKREQLWCVCRVG